MRALLADIASKVTQGRLDILHKGMDLPGKPQKLFDSDTKPLMDQENLGALIASKKPKKRAMIRKPFRGRQKFGTQNSTGSNTAQTQITEAGVPSATIHRQDPSPPVGESPSNISIRVDQADKQPRGPPDPYRRSSISTVQEGHRGSQTPKSGLLQQPICYSKENRGAQTSPGFEEAELTCGTKELQNGNIDADIPDDSKQELHEISGSG
ncbi:hypothetical protein AYI69_g3590 [Smittium culicis]|uniref:Uncharacterized protein n=1 Tax=Smittium culicis TaxID=133412 RepID=A0A1R1YJA2_9FUNG|nr:hypothetical protein AYI69_g3590 [Smittium culicis]